MSILALAAAVIPACGSSSGGGGGPLLSGFTMNLNGGNATAAAGGQGGYLEAYGYVTGKVGIVSSGSINTSVANLPGVAKPFLGSNVLTISSNGTLAVGNGNSTGGAAGAYLTAGNGTVTNATGTVTGIWVQAGVTLTIKPNRNSDTAANPHQDIYIDLAEGWFIEGTVKAANRDTVAEGDGLSPNTANFQSNYANNFQMTGSGKIDTSGANNGAGAGGNGGYLYVYTYNFNSNGQLISRGGNGSTNGGSGGDIYVYCNWGWVINRGAMTSNGGTGAAGTGGSAGYIDVEAGDYSFLYNSGALSANGANGTTGGGSGGSVYLYSSEGDVVNVANLSSWGGNATVSGNAGSGDYVNIYAYGQIRSVGTYDTHGGTAAAGNGGDGGYVEFDGYGAYSYAGDYIPDEGGVWVAGNIITTGGNGTTGAGDGGYAYVYCSTDGYAATGRPNKKMDALFVGYGSVQKSGGNGTSGGYSDYTYIRGRYTYDDVSIYFAPSVVNNATITAKGGTGSTTTGGGSNYFDIETDDSIYPPYDQGVTNTANVDLSGGNGQTNGGSPGYVYMWGDFYLRNSGTLTCNGGNGVSGTGASGANDIELYSTGPITNSGALHVNGGSTTTGNAGDGGYVYIYGPTISNGAAVSANGGNSTAAQGGDGGYIEIFADLSATVNSGALTVTKGTGATGTPVVGDIYIDGAHILGP